MNLSASASPRRSVALARIVCFTLFSFFAALPAFAQPSPAGASAAQDVPAAVKPAIPERLRIVEGALDETANTLKQKDLSDPRLQQMRQKLNPVLLEIQDILDILSKEAAAAKSRLDQLGDEPKKDEPPESAEVAAQRVELKKAFDAVDALDKRAKVARVRVDQLASEITNRRRGLLQRTLFKNSRSILNPLFWLDVVREAPSSVNSIVSLLSTWASFAGGKLNGRWSEFAVFLAGLLALSFAGWFALRGFLRRHNAPERATPFQKARNAIWVSIVIFAVPSIAMIALIAGLKYFDLITPRIAPLVEILQQSVRNIALTVGIARGVLAPSKAGWRLIDIDSVRAQRLSRLALRVVCIVALMRVVDILLTITYASLDLSQAVLAVGTLAVAVTIVRTLYGTARVEAQLDSELGPVVEEQSGYLGLWRLLVWLSVIAMIAADLFGYFNLANFIVTQLVWIVFVFTSAFMLVRLTETGFAHALKPESMPGKMAMSTFGVRAGALGQSQILLSGIAKLIVYFAAAIVILAPFGVETVSVLDTAQAVFFGFTIGGVRISLATLSIALALLAGGFLIARAFQRWLEQQYLPATGMDSGLQNSIATSAGYIGVIAALSLALGYLGLNFEKLAFVAGALSLGIGFGLQSIVSNFVSGLILLWERSIKVGDWVVIGSDEGHVRRINVRSTEIETFDKQTVIVPNSNLISGVVKNWVSYNTTGRVIVPVGVSYDADPEQVRTILLRCARTHDLVLDDPEPSVYFAGFGDSSLDFELRFHIANVDKSLGVRSHMRFEIFRQLKEAGIEIPFPQRDINIRDFEKLVKMFKQNGTGASDSPKQA
ncbi:MAG: DUF3772 domain-containing protein [Beijerinckiaceae bacterium]